MGVVRTDESRRAEIEEFRKMLLSCSNGGVALKVITQNETNHPRLLTDNPAYEQATHQKLVCVTSGVSFLGIAIVKQLLVRGYAVRIIVDNQEDVERLREIENSEEIIIRGNTSSNNNNNINQIGVVVAKLNELKSLMEAFDGCHAVFHTTAFIDPSGFSGYSLWYALGKLKAEKASWRIAVEKELKLATICSGLITGPRYICTNPSSTIAYLKGGQDMYADGLLATIDVNKLAEIHVKVLEGMNKTGGGRYVCFDKVIRCPDEVQRLERETGVHINTSSNDALFRFELSNRKLDRLMSQVNRCTNVS
uniref:cinnamoyl-CoA reductase-like SNL6 isoform X2 n=1 Tax=Erigeron canadensis TaxID=72917 RepID=UPI001CB99CF3|nr:cinnamoyl-CoA reductase-like SNL6 isoform X2 [Erigeron canadensis]